MVLDVVTMPGVLLWQIYKFSYVLRCNDVSLQHNSGPFHPISSNYHQWVLKELGIPVEPKVQA